VNRRAARLTATSLVVALASVACGGSGRDDAAGGAKDRSPSTSAAVASSTTASTVPNGVTPATAPPGCTDVAPLGRYAVGRQQITLVDPTRPTAADPGRNLAAATSRTLPVSVLYPASGDAGPAGTFTDDAAARAGRFPVVIYSHGADSTGTERNDTLAAWARAGYVVVAPTYPLSSHPGGQITDVANQPADVMFVDAQLTDPTSPLAPLAAHMEPDCLAFAGHSLGAITTIAATYDPCCRPKGQKAAVAIAGGLFAPTPELDWATVPKVPLLLVHGEKDARVPFAKSLEMRSTLPGDEWLLRFPEGQHSTMFDAPLNEVLVPVVVAFLNAELRGEPAGLDSVPASLAGRADAVFEPPGPH